MTELDNIVAKFRKASPNIAAAFDEVQRRLTLLETPTSPPAGWPPVDTTPPAWTPLRTRVARTQLEFSDIYASAVDGDRIEVREAVFNGQQNWFKRFTGKGIELVVAPDVRFMGSAYNLSAIWVTGNRHRIFGCEQIQNPIGHGVTFYPSSDILWRGLKIGTTGPIGGTGLRALAVNGNIERLDLEGESTNCGHDLSLDPHPEKGTGLHPFYWGGDETQTGTAKNSRVVLYSHDCASGSNQIGGKAEDNQFYLLAKRLTKVAANQVAGNACQLFGNKVLRNRVWVEGEDLAGRVVEANFTLGPGSTGNVVWHGRGERVRLSPKYAPNPGVTYQDCT